MVLSPLIQIPMALAAQFAPPLEGGWHLHSQPKQCQLVQVIPNYGEAHFLRLPGQPLTLNLVGKRELFAPGDIAITPLLHEWRNAESPRLEVIIEHRQGTIIRVPDPDATALLMQLYRGYGFVYKQAGWFDAGEPILVQVSSVSFRDHYHEFVSCFAQLMPATFDEVEKSSLAFLDNDEKLQKGGLKRLKLLVAYLAADPNISAIFIDGHTDNRGTERFNYELSKARAETVENYLLQQGISKALFKVRFHGERYPIGDNGSETGRQANRRVTVRLERQAERVAVR